MQVVSNDIIKPTQMYIIVMISELRLFVNLFINMFTYHYKIYHKDVTYKSIFRTVIPHYTEHVLD